MKENTLYEVRKEEDGLTAELKVNDGGINTALNLLKIIKKTEKQLLFFIFSDLKSKGLPVPELDEENKQLHHEVIQKLKSMTAEEAEQLIKDIHGLIVKGK